MTFLSRRTCEVPLGEICEFKYGKSLPASSRKPGTHPVYGSNGQVGFHSLPMTTGPTIIIGRKGSIGEVCYSPEACWPIDTTYFIDGSCTSQDVRWLAYALGTLELTTLNKSAAVPGLNRDDAYRRTLLLPPLSEQRRIAAILDQADALRAMRRAALAQLDEMAQAIFVEMFVDGPIWPEATIGSVALAMRTGPFGSQLLHSEFVDSGIAVLGIDNAVQNKFAWAERRFITEQKYRGLTRYRVYPRDIIVTIMGTCGRVAIVPHNVPLSITTKHLCSITLDEARCLPEYLHACLLRHPVVLQQLGATAKGAVMPGLNMGIIRDTKIPLPPIQAQTAFAEALRQIDQSVDCMAKAGAELDSLFASLQHRAFTGAL